MKYLLLLLLLMLPVVSGCESTHAQSRKYVSEELAKRQANHQKSLEHYNTGLSLYEELKYKEAYTEFKAATTANPRNVDAWLGFGVIAFKQDEFPEAAEAFHNASRLSPRRFEPHFNLGSIYESVGRYESAIASYERALELSPDQLEVMENLARCYIVTEQKLDIARKYIKRALLLEHRPAWRAWLETQARRLDPSDTM